MKEALCLHNDANRMRKRRLRMRAGNPIACLLCYLIAFAIPLAWQYAAIRLIYPWKLASTAPDVTAHLLSVFPALGRWLSPVAVMTAEGTFSLRDMLAAREQVWLSVLAVCAAAAWALTLLTQLTWRFAHSSPILSARQTARAIRSYRMTMLVIWLFNAAIAAGLWVFGVQFITGRTLWDYLVSFGVFLLLPLSAAIVSRFAASPAISGKYAFFKRL